MNLPLLSLRNVFRNTRRSIATIAAIAVGLVAVNLFGGYIADVYRSLQIQAVAGERLGHLTVLKEGMLTLGKLRPERYMFNADEAQRLRQTLAGVEGVRLVTPRLTISGMASNGRSSTIFIGEALVPEDMPALREGAMEGSGGRLEPGRKHGIAVSSELAQLLGYRKGDVMTLLTSTLRGQANAIDGEIVDIFDTGNINTNDKYLVAPLSLATALLDTEGTERFIVLLDDIAQTEAARTRIVAALQQQGLQVEVKTWRELSAFYTQVRGLFDMIFTFIACIVFIVAAMSIANAMAMSVMERTREVGTLQAMGMRRRSVVGMFVCEALWLAAFGVVVGAAVTYGVAALVNGAGISYVPPNSSVSVPLLVDLQSPVVAGVGAAVVALALLAAALPAWRASRRDIVEALAFH